jgi:hypothetical protein
MVGVVGSSPIEPTNESENPVRRIFKTAASALARKANEQDGTANVDRNNFGATLVEDHFRLCSCRKVNAAPQNVGPHFFFAFARSTWRLQGIVE